MEIITSFKMSVPGSLGLTGGPTLFIGLKALTFTPLPPLVVRFLVLDPP